jgi:hypothetical protein
MRSQAPLRGVHAHFEDGVAKGRYADRPALSPGDLTMLRLPILLGVLLLATDMALGQVKLPTPGKLPAQTNQPGQPDPPQNPDDLKKKIVPEGEEWSYDKIIEHLGYNLQFIDGVIWVIDESPSMADDVETVRGELDKWFKILNKNAKVGIVTYSEKPKLLLRPTINHELAKKAFGVYKTREAGAENLYAAIAFAANNLPKGENLALVIATDEVGDDDKFLVQAVRALARRKVVVYAICPNAAFGKRKWAWTAVDAVKRETKHYHSDLGPETGTPEMLFDFHFIQRSKMTRLNFTMDQREWATKAGWAPYGLQMLARSSGGQVYNLETDTFVEPIDFENAKKYRPDFSGLKDLAANIRKSPWRSAVHKVATIWAKSFKPFDREFKDPYPSDRKVVVQTIKTRLLPVVKNNKTVALGCLKLLRNALEQESWSGSDQDRSLLRWRANLELAYANALVAYYHLNQFEADYRRFSSNTYVFTTLFPIANPKMAAGYKIICVNDNKDLYDGITESATDKLHKMLDHADYRKIKSTEDLRKAAEAALKVVAANHPDTPWAVMAAKTKETLGHYEIRSMPVGAWTRGTGKQ